MKNFWKQCPLVAMILVSTVGLTIYAVFGVVIGKYNFKVSMTETVFSAVLKQDFKEDTVLVDNGMGEDLAEEDSIEQDSIEQDLNKMDVDSTDETEVSENTETLDDTEASEDAMNLGSPTQYIPRKKKKPRSPYYDDPGKTALTTDYAYEMVDKSYFDDALFVGDSRIEGMCLYSGLDNADFNYRQGLTVYDLMTEKLLDAENKQETLKVTLSKKQYGKIFMMIGINELGKKTTQDYAMQYKANLEQIRALQPNAEIFIMGIMNVSSEYSESNDVFNNDNINSKNVAIAGLANGIDTFYFDINPVISDEMGGIKKEYTWDGIHLKAQYYNLVTEFLMEHGVKELVTA